MTRFLQKTLSETKILGKLFDDEPNPDSQLFNFPKFAIDLEKVLLSADAITPYSIVIHGDWGSGKTSLAKRVYESIKTEGKISDGTKLKVIWFDAWQYEKLDPVTALLRIIADAHKGHKAYSAFKKVAAGVGLGFLDLGLRVMSANMSSIKNIDELMTRFIGSQIEDIKTISDKLSELVKNERLVIFIDDLDRCSVENALEMLEAIKMFLNVKGIISLMIVDITKLERAWKLRYSNNLTATLEGKEHLDKIFQLRLSLPEKTSAQMEEYVKSLVSSLSDSEKLLIKEGCPRNPRKVKRILNLVYFLSSEASEDLRGKLFPMLIVWAILTVEFSEIVILIKSNWKTLIQMSLYSRHLDEFENLKLVIPNIRNVIKGATNVNLNGLTITYKQILQSTIEGFDKVLENESLFNFLKAIAKRYDMQVNNNNSDNVDRTLEKLYENEGKLLQEVLTFTGLIA
jgi:hypothetical protein